MTHVKPRKNIRSWWGRRALRDVIADDLYDAQLLLLDAEKSLEDWKAYRDTMAARVARLERRLRDEAAKEPSHAQVA